MGFHGPAAMVTGKLAMRALPLAETLEGVSMPREEPFECIRVASARSVDQSKRGIGVTRSRGGVAGSAGGSPIGGTAAVGHTSAIPEARCSSDSKESFVRSFAADRLSG
jgi:hypothetical protein